MDRYKSLYAGFFLAFPTIGFANPQCILFEDISAGSASGKIRAIPDYEFGSNDFTEFEAVFRPPVEWSSTKFNGEEVEGANGSLEFSLKSDGKIIYKLPSPFTEENGIEYEGASGFLATNIKGQIDKNSIQMKLGDGTVLSADAVGFEIDIPDQFFPNFVASVTIEISGSSKSGDFEYLEVVSLDGLSNLLVSARNQYEKHVSAVVDSGQCTWGESTYFYRR